MKQKIPDLMKVLGGLIDKLIASSVNPYTQLQSNIPKTRTGGMFGRSIYAKGGRMGSRSSNRMQSVVGLG